MNNPPDGDMQDFQAHPGRLILPAPQERTSFSPYGPPIRPEHLIRRQASAAPSGLFSRVAFLWRTEPIYRVLWIAIALVIIASVFFVSLGASALLNSNSPSTTQTNSIQPSFTPTHPSNAQVVSSITPTTGVTPTPTFPPTPTPFPSPSPSPSPSPTTSMTLTVQITSLPSTVRNYTTVHIGVMTNEPNIKVLLWVTYSTKQATFNSTMMTDNGGNANFYWYVSSNSHKSISHGVVKAVATDQSGQRAVIQPVTVNIANY